jgi:hypothetical protein
MTQNIEGTDNMQNQEQQQQASQWVQMIGQVMEKLTGANMSTTISFDDLEIDVPKAQGPGGRDLGGAKWKINGKIIWSTEGHKTASGV